MSAMYGSRTSTIVIIPGRYNNFKSKSIPNYMMFLWSRHPHLLKVLQIEQILSTSATHTKIICGTQHSLMTEPYHIWGQGHISLHPDFILLEFLLAVNLAKKKKYKILNMTKLSLQLQLSYKLDKIPAATERWWRFFFFFLVGLLYFLHLKKFIL